MSLNQKRLKGEIIKVLDECQQENTNPNNSKELLADRLSTAIIDEIKQMTIVYTSGLVAPSGAVVGTLKTTIN